MNDGCLFVLLGYRTVEEKPVDMGRLEHGAAADRPPTNPSRRRMDEPTELR